MRSFAEIEKQFESRKVFLPNKKDYTRVYGYSGGKCLGSFDNEKQAHDNGAAAFETVFDKVSYDGHMTAYAEYQALLVDTFENELRAEYSHLNDATYKIIYSMSYERGHSYGYDSVASYMEDYAEMAQEIINANK